VKTERKASEFVPLQSFGSSVCEEGDKREEKREEKKGKKNERSIQTIKLIFII
jgi:hypothetical protein